MRRMGLYALLLLGVWFILQNFTLANLSVKMLFVSSNNYVELEDGMETETHVFDQLIGNNFKNSNDPDFEYLSVFNSIQYFPEKNFYLIRDYTTSTFYKVDSLGHLKYEFGIRNITADDFSFIAAQGLAFTKDTVYDLSEDSPLGQQFEKVVNEKLEFSTEEWNRVFKELYKKSSTVIYNEMGDPDNQSGILYFHHQNKWIKLYSLNRRTIIRESGKDLKVRIEGEDFNAKYTSAYQSYYLKDATAKVFSNNTRTSDQDFRMGAHRLPNTAILDTELDYPKVGEIKVKAFKKKDYIASGYFNPGIPVDFYGVGFYQLKRGNTSLNFKTNASKTVFGKVSTDLYLFGPPKEFEHKNEVRFLAYDYHVNLRDNGKKGLYIIRMK